MFFSSFSEEKVFNHRCVNIQTWNSPWIHIYMDPSRDMHSYADIYISRSTPEIRKWMQTYLSGLQCNKNEERCRNTHTLFTGVTNNTSQSQGKFLIFRFTPGHTCRIKVVNFQVSEYLVVLFMHQWILIHKLLAVATEEKKPELTCSADFGPLCCPLVELSSKRHCWHLLSLFLLTFVFSSSPCSGNAIPWEAENFWNLLNYFFPICNSYEYSGRNSSSTKYRAWKQRKNIIANKVKVKGGVPPSLFCFIYPQKSGFHEGTWIFDWSF